MKTKDGNRFSPLNDIDTGDSMAPAPTQEAASSDARVPPSANSRKRTESQMQSRGRIEGLENVQRIIRSNVNHVRGEEPIKQEASRETREADVQSGPSSQPMNRSVRSTQSGRRDNHTRPGKTRDERDDNNGRKEVDVNKGEGEGGREGKEAEGHELSPNKDLRPSNSMREPHDNSRESARSAILRLPSHHSHHGQTQDERGDSNVREDRGANKEAEGEGEREVKMVKRNELSTNQGLRPSNPVRKQDNRRDSARVPSNSSRHGQTRNERSNEHVREQLGDRGANQEKEREREMKEAEGDEISTNQDLRPSNPVRRQDNRRESARVPSHSSRHGQARDERGDANVREDGGTNEEAEGEGEREIKDAGVNGLLSTNQGLGPSNPMPPRQMHHRRRESAHDAILRLEGTLRRRENDVYVLSTRNEQLSTEIKILSEKLTHLQSEQDQTRQLLHERTVELSSAQLFLGKADIISVTDVSKMVDILNAEISQASNSIADSLFDHQDVPATPDTTELNQLLHKVQSSIGARLCSILARRLSQPSAELDPMITQLVLQAGLSEACYLTINDWNPPLRDTSSTLSRIYANMRPTVGQVIAGRWRALTRTYINGPASQDSEDGIHVQDAKRTEIQEANAEYLISTLRDLLTIVGWSSKGPRHDLPSEYKEKMRFLSDEALKLHETIGRGITSKDLIVEIIPCETPFDPTKMDDADRQRGKPDVIPDETVACTVELGLRYKCAKPGADSEETGLILKPKVLLASVLDEEVSLEVTPPEPQN